MSQVTHAVTCARQIWLMCHQCRARVCCHREEVFCFSVRSSKEGSETSGSLLKSRQFFSVLGVSFSCLEHVVAVRCTRPHIAFRCCRFQCCSCQVCCMRPTFVCETNGMFKRHIVVNVSMRSPDGSSFRDSFFLSSVQCLLSRFKVCVSVARRVGCSSFSCERVFCVWVLRE